MTQNIKEKVLKKSWEKATTKINPLFDDTKRNFDYQKPLMDIVFIETFVEVGKVIDGGCGRQKSVNMFKFSECKIGSLCSTCKGLKQKLGIK